MRNMQPSFRQLFFAQNWPMKIWLTVFPICCTTFALWYSGGPTALGVAGTNATIVVSLVAGFLLAVVLFSLLLVPIHQWQARKNGARFHVGDQVYILAGPHRGRTARVYSHSQGDTVCVELGEQAKAENKDTFSPWQLLRAQVGEDGGNPDTSIDPPTIGRT
jgi:hypothetical protein